MPVEIQRLRCKVNFEALTFVQHVRSLGDVLVNRLLNPSVESDIAVGTGYLKQVIDSKGLGKFVALHLRFDKVHTSSLTFMVKSQLWTFEIRNDVI